MQTFCTHTGGVLCGCTQTGIGREDSPSLSYVLANVQKGDRSVATNIYKHHSPTSRHCSEAAVCTAHLVSVHAASTWCEQMWACLSTECVSTPGLQQFYWAPALFPCQGHCTAQVECTPHPYTSRLFAHSMLDIRHVPFVFFLLVGLSLQHMQHYNHCTLYNTPLL